MDKKYRDDLIKAGHFAHLALVHGMGCVKKGASYNDVVRSINEKIKELGAIPAFPPQLALNEVAAHFLPAPGTDIIFNDELVCVDVGVCVDGAIGDCAGTVDLSGKHALFIQTAQEALAKAIGIIKVGTTFGEIGRIIDATAKAKGLLTVRNLSGHGLGLYQIHDDPNVPNYDNGSTVKVEPGMVFAIEPFVTNGAGRIYDAGSPTIFSLYEKRPVRSQFARQVLTRILTFQGLPFAIHDLIDDNLSLPKVKFGIKELLEAGIIGGHAPLVEENKGLVAQAEHTVLIDSDGSVIITTM